MNYRFMGSKGTFLNSIRVSIRFVSMYLYNGDKY